MNDKNGSVVKQLTDLNYQDLFEQMGECVLVVSPEFRIISANPQAVSLCGYAENQMEGMLLADVLSLNDEVEQTMILDGNVRLIEHVLKKLNGESLPVEVSISVIRDKNANPVHIQMMLQDITERKQNERTLKRHMRALSVIGEVTAALFRSSNIEERIPEVLESLGYAVGVFSCVIFDVKDSSLQVKYQWMDHPAAGFDAISVVEPFTQSLMHLPERVFSVTDVQTQSPAIPNISLLIIPIQGASRSWGFLALFDKEDRLSWLPTIFDIVQTTANLLGAALERINNEETLRLSERRNRIIVDALPDLLLRIDLSGQILDYNANPNHPLYLAPEAVIGQTLSSLWTPEISKTILGGNTQQTFEVSHWVDGFSLPNHDNTFEARLYPLSHTEALVIIRDITEQARLNQMKSDFINRASHELRTPLTAAILMTELIQGGGTEEELAEYWRTLNGELNRQKNLINELLMAGRLESGAMTIEATAMDLLPILDESLLAVKPLAAKRHITLSFENNLHSTFILGDKSGLQQVFINLINNAVKFSPEGKSVEVLATQSGEEALVSITDHGLGIPPDSIPHLFERFYRAKNVTVAEIPGSGIGLYIVKSIVEELNGSINVESEINKGTKFTVHLKLVK
ncbi:MAG: ATP-binding protein [Anaerolineales bacterium]